MTTNDAFEAEFEFKGKTLHPFSQGRMRTAFSIGVRMGGESGNPTLSDIHAILFICLSEPKFLSKSHRDPDGFWQKLDEWVDENITASDYDEEAKLVKAILEAAFQTKAEPVTDISDLGGDNLGN